MHHQTKGWYPKGLPSRSARSAAVYCPLTPGKRRFAAELRQKYLSRVSVGRPNHWSRVSSQDKSLTRCTGLLGIAGGIGVPGGAAVLANHVLAIDLGSGPGSHPGTFVDVRQRPARQVRIAGFFRHPRTSAPHLRGGTFGVSPTRAAAVPPKFLDFALAS